jgi:lantibiotic leader peptide-processing serine protease
MSKKTLNFKNAGWILAAALSWSATAAAGERTLVAAKSDADYDQLRSEAVSSGAKILRDLRQIRLLVVDADRSSKANLAASVHAKGTATDRIVRIVPDQMRQEFFGASFANPLLAARSASTAKISPPTAVTPDPALSFPGLLWNLKRIEAPGAWQTTLGDPDVTVGVADTGLDYTHSELATQVDEVVDFTATENPAICPTFVKPSPPNTDADFAALFGGPANTDWNGHGSWIGGNIAAALDGQGINGIAPKISLVALKISQWCGSAYDSTILDAFLYAADHGIDVVSISFGGYLDRTDPAQDLIYGQYVDAVQYALAHGTVIVAAAGNEHARIGAGGRVLSHGTLTTPGAPVADVFGQYETPGGIPGIIDVSSTGNRVETPSRNCTSESLTYPSSTCKLTTDAHQPTGIGRTNQLAYYSNYGPRIDIAAPGGARKFNLPVWDGGGTPGFPVTTTDGTKVWEAFSITSDWALEIPCYLLSAPFYPNDCYSTIQGTSMATPHVSAVLALIASANPQWRHHPRHLVAALLGSALPVHGNRTEPLSATDTSAGDRTGVACADQSGGPTSGYCHLGGEPIEDDEAYGAGLVDARRAVAEPTEDD